jgi:hypothetical protein
MIYRTCENYYENEEDYKLNDQECLICLENKRDGEYNIILNFNNVYLKTCSCNGYIHMECLNKWYLTSNSCPICRKLIIKKNNNLYIDDFLKKKQLIINNVINNDSFFFVINLLIKIIKISQLFIGFLCIYIIIKISLIKL